MSNRESEAAYSGPGRTPARHVRLLVASLMACGLLLVAAPAALAAAPTCQDDPSESAQAGAPAQIFFQCTPSSGLTYHVVTTPSHGTLDTSDIANGDVTYKANSAYTGSDSFTFTATDGSSQTSNVATVTISVSPENQCFDDSSEATAANTAKLVSLSCSSGTGGNETYSIVTNPSHGTLDKSDIANGNVTYTPTAGFIGTDSFTFHANDGVMTSATSTVTIIVGNGCSGQTVTTAENQATQIFFSCTSANGGTETYSVVGNPSHGTLDTSDIANGDVTYSPAHGFTGTDSFTFHANDGTDTSNTATVTVDVTPPPPECSDVNLTTAENTALTVPLRCISPAGETMTLSIPNGQGPSHGTLGAINQAGQTVTYTPASGYVSTPLTPDTFQYIATDSSGNPSVAGTVSIQVGVSCSPATAATNENQPVEVSLQCSGPDGVPLTLAVVGSPTHGTLGTLDQSGRQVLYKPVSGFSGSDSFTFHATGAGQTSTTVAATVTVNPVALTCSGADVSTLENQAITLPASCTNRQGATLTLSTASGGAPGHGTLSFSNANQTITYTPTTGFTGPDSFTYQAADGSGATPTALVRVTVGLSCSDIDLSTSVGQPVTVPLQCAAPDNTLLTLAISQQPAHGTLGQISAIGSSVQYTPGPGFAGTDTFKYMATGGGQTSPAATATITVGAAAPQCTDLSASTAPGTAVSIPLECGGPAGTTLTLAVGQVPANGTLGTIDQTHHTVSYTPAAGFVGQDTFTYHATGGGQTSPDASVSITVGPTCSDTQDSINENEPSELNLRCVGQRGQTLTLAVTGQPLHGTLGHLDSGDQQVLYTPDPNYVGPDAITYQATAGASTSNVAVESITVGAPQASQTPVQPPTCQAVSVATAASTAVSVPLSCTDPAGHTLTLLIVGGVGPQHGTLGAIDQTHQTVQYTPVSGYTGSDGFDYEASNGNAVSSAVPVSIQVGPTCSSTQSSGAVGQAQQVTLNCIGTGTLAYQIVSSASHGTLGTAASNGTVTYTPTAGYSGPDGFTYKVTSGGVSSNVATATINVTNGPPSCQDVSLSTAVGTAVSVPLTCSEPGGASLTLLVPPSGAPQNGSLGAIDQTHHTISYTPVSGFSGTDTFTYAASDGSSMASPATVMVSVGPSCSDKQQQVTENQSVTIDLQCIAPTTPTIAVVGSPGHGTLGTINQAAQTIQYTPTTGFTGPDQFTIHASAGGQSSQTAVISLNVLPAPPACNDLTLSTPASTAVSVPLHCTGPSGATLNLFVPSGNGPSDGTLGAIDQTHQTVQYTPASGFQGTDSFTYQASDGTRISDPATVTINVGAPACANLTASTNENTAGGVQLSCAGGSGSLTYSVVTGPAHGTLSGLNASTGAVTYTPASGFHGQDTFTYRATAGGQSSNTATVTITVNPPPSCGNASQSTDENVAVTIQLSCTDSAGRTLTLSTLTAPAHGTLGTIDQTHQTVQYTPTSGYSGQDTFTYKATAGGQSSNTATVTITVIPPPNCSDTTAATDVGTAVSVPLSCNDSAGRTLTLSTLTSPAHGTLGTIDQTHQTVQYTPASGYIGPDSFTYQAAAGGQSSNTATVTLTVNSLPTCSNVSQSATENQAVVVQLSCTGGTGALTLSTTSAPAHGTIGSIDQTNQTIQYTPASGYTGGDSFAYSATDTTGGSSTPATATITVTVPPPPPSCTNTGGTAIAGHPVTIALRCTDSAGRTLALSVVTKPAHGALGAINQAGKSVVYNPASGFTGTDKFTYHATAGGQTSNTAAATIKVIPKITAITVTPTAAVTSTSIALVKVAFTGTGQGTLTLKATTTIHHQKRIVTVGLARFALKGHGTATIRVPLNATGKTLLRKGHNKLTTSALFAFLAGAHPPVHATIKLHKP